MAREATLRGGLDSPLAGQARETSGVTSALLLAYLEHAGGLEAVAAVLGRCGLTACEGELRDENCWFSWDTKIALFEATADVLDKPDFLEHLAALALDLNVGSALKVALRTLGSPQLVYRSVVRANAQFNGSHAMELITMERGQARIRFAGIGDEQRYHPLDCQYSAAMLRVVPQLFGLPVAQLRHVKCVGHGDESCEYELHWHEHVSAGRRALAAGVGSVGALAASLLLLPGALPAAIGASVATVGVLTLSELRRHRQAWEALQREAEDSADVAQRLFASLQDLVSDLRLDEVLNKVTRNAQAAVGGREFALLLREGDRFLCHNSSDLPPATVAALEAWSSLSPRAGEQSMVVDDVRDVPALAPLVDKSMPLCSLASAPLTFFGETFGVLIALGTQSRTFLPRDVEVLQSFATQVSIALHNARRYHVTKTQADGDALTGLLNHRSFHEALDRALSGADERVGCVALIDLDNFKAINDEDGHGAGDQLLQAAARALSDACREGDLAFRVGGDEFALLLSGLEEQPAAAVVARVCAAISVLDPRLGASAGVARLTVGQAKDAVLKQADERLYAAKRGRERPDRRSSANPSGAARVAVDLLLSVLELYDGPVVGHSSQVAELSERVAIRMGLPATEREQTRLAALLHDLGKLGLPAGILDKPGPLEAAEWLVMRRHPDIGADLILRAPGLDELAGIVRASHERWDGGGYPAGTAGDRIPLGARIVAACDAFDAIVSERPYRAPRTQAEAINELQACAGSQFDPDVVSALVAELVFMAAAERQAA